MEAMRLTTSLLKVLSSFLRLATVERCVFKSQPLQIAKRWQKIRCKKHLR